MVRRSIKFRRSRTFQREVPLGYRGHFDPESYGLVQVESLTFERVLFRELTADRRARSSGPPDSSTSGVAVADYIPLVAS